MQVCNYQSSDFCKAKENYCPSAETHEGIVGREFLGLYFIKNPYFVYQLFLTSLTPLTPHKKKFFFFS